MLGNCVCVFNFQLQCAILVLIVMQCCGPSEGFILRLITESLQNNVAGEPIVHQETKWDFDPEAAKKARAIFYEVNGFRAAKYIERIGVGIDGREEERRLAQAERDVGRLNGEHNINFP